MTFVNEYITKEDYDKYGQLAIENQYSFYPGWREKGADWTIDRERNIFLREVRPDRGPEGPNSTWIFFWKGNLIKFFKENIEYRHVQPGIPAWAHFRLSGFEIPLAIETKRNEIFQDLKDAFVISGRGIGNKREFDVQLESIESDLFDSTFTLEV